MKLLTTAAVVALTASASFAETVRATITGIQPNYVTEQVEVIDRRCQNIEVPVYGRVQGGGASGGDVLAGMIIGGLLGKGITNKDNGAAAGAVLGGVIAADKNQSKQVITGYRTERQCFDTVQYQPQQVFKNNYITFEWNGIQGSAYTYNNYSVGQSIPVTVTIRAN
jgi:uncharacterized protein YcfJ